jgi:hypothetical protein
MAASRSSRGKHIDDVDGGVSLHHVSQLEMGGITGAPNTFTTYGTDGTFATGNNNATLPSQLAVKTYVDTGHGLTIHNAAVVTGPYGVPQVCTIYEHHDTVNHTQEIIVEGFVFAAGAVAQMVITDPSILIPAIVPPHAMCVVVDNTTVVPGHVMIDAAGGHMHVDVVAAATLLPTTFQNAGNAGVEYIYIKYRTTT